MAAVLNYLRDISDGDYPVITQQDVINMSKKDSNHTRPWQASELIGEGTN